jgi:hypothetical protein
MNVPHTPRDKLVSSPEDDAAIFLFLVEACELHRVNPHARLIAPIDLGYAFSIHELPWQHPPAPLRPSDHVGAHRLSSVGLVRTHRSSLTQGAAAITKVGQAG